MIELIREPDHVVDVSLNLNSILSYIETHGQDKEKLASLNTSVVRNEKGCWITHREGDEDSGHTSHLHISNDASILQAGWSSGVSSDSNSTPQLIFGIAPAKSLGIALEGQIIYEANGTIVREEPITNNKNHLTNPTAIFLNSLLTYALRGPFIVR